MTTAATRTRTHPQSASAPRPDGPVRLAAEGVRLAYDDRVVVDGLDLRLTDGSFTAIVGPNGCGKSTLLRALGRLLRPQAGEAPSGGRARARAPTPPAAPGPGPLPATAGGSGRSGEP